MGLYSVRGTISQLGQCEFDNNLMVYAYVEIVDPTGGRRLVKKVAVCVDIQAALHPGLEGHFFFDEIFVSGRKILCQFWGISTVERFVVDQVDMRAGLARIHLFRGILYTPLFGLGLPMLIAGIGQTWSLLNGSANRTRFFRGEGRKDAEVAKSRPPLPERLGLALRGAAVEFLRKHLLERTPGN
jgi:hypothetical protein